MQENEYRQTMSSAFLAIMVVGVTITTVSVVTVLYSIWATEKNKADTLSLYAYLKMDQIKGVYDKCDEYMDDLLDNSEEDRIMGKSDGHNEAERKASKIMGNIAANQQDIHSSDLSEEEKEEQKFNSFMQRQRQIR
jgi:hypothetical protein